MKMRISVAVLIALALGLLLACGGGGSGLGGLGTPSTEIRTVVGTVVEPAESLVNQAISIESIDSVFALDSNNITYLGVISNGAFTINLPVGNRYAIFFMSNENFVAVVSYQDRSWFLLQSGVGGLNLGRVSLSLSAHIAESEYDPWEGYVANEPSPWEDANDDGIPDMLLDPERVQNINSIWHNVPSANAPVSRENHVAVWTGDTGDDETSHRMIVWGGTNPETGSRTQNGGIYDPEIAAWTSMSTGSGVPTAREFHTAVWTGMTSIAAASNRLIVWGGFDGAATQTGAIYNPVPDTWIPTSTLTDTPSQRYHHTAVWTGDTGNAGTSYKMIIWGGTNGIFNLNSGGIYDPLLDTWIETSAGTNCPAARYSHTAVWTGDTGTPSTSNKMIVWGGTFGDGGYFNDGGVFDPLTNTWTALSCDEACPGARDSHTAIWTGTTSNPLSSYKMIVWGGIGIGGSYFDTGGIYDPLLDTWTEVETFGDLVPSPRKWHIALWTGSTGNVETENRMIVWGGYMDAWANSGSVYNPVDDSWSEIPDNDNNPFALKFFTGIWTGDTGSEMTSNKIILWGNR